MADIVPHEASTVWGLLYRLTSHDLARLDQYEGYPCLYDRFRVTVEPVEGPDVDAWIYSVVDKAEFVPPTPEYLTVLEAAAEALGFPEEYRRALASTPTKKLGT